MKYSFPCLDVLNVRRIDLVYGCLDKPFTREDVALLTDEDMCNIADAIGEACMATFWKVLHREARAIIDSKRAASTAKNAPGKEGR